MRNVQLHVFRVRAPEVRPRGPAAAARLVTSRAACPRGHHHRRHSGDTTHFRCPSAWVAIQTLLRHVWRPKCGNPCGISPPAAPSPAKLRSWPPTRAVQGVSLAKIHGPAGPAATRADHSVTSRPVLELSAQSYKPWRFCPFRRFCTRRAFANKMTGEE